MHIQEAIEKYGRTAAGLAQADLDADEYHQNITKAAKAMVDKGLTDWTYVTQYDSGNSTWGGTHLDDYIVTMQDKEGKFIIPYA